MQSSPYVCNKRKPGRGVGTLLGALKIPSDKEVYLTQTCLRGLFSRCHSGFMTLSDLTTKQAKPSLGQLYGLHYCKNRTIRLRIGGGWLMASGLKK